MQVLDGQLLLSATDLVGHLACNHLSFLEMGAAKGECSRPFRDDPQLDLIARRGLEHERWYLGRLRAEGKAVVEIGQSLAKTRSELESAAARTLEAMRAGSEVIYQGTLFDGRWRGHPDFLVRCEAPSDLGPWSYEPVETKLVRRVMAAAVLQVCVYGDLLSAAQGRAPEQGKIVTGDKAEEIHRLTDYSAYYRYVKRSFEAWLADSDRAQETYPDPVDHCRICRWYGPCSDRRREDDHPSRVASITRSQTRTLAAAGVSTLTELAHLTADRPVPGLRETPLRRLRNQARLQMEQYQDGLVRYELVPPDGDRPQLGLALLPPPSPGDLFLDIEADPWAYDGGLEYLIGTLVDRGGQPDFTPFWAHSPAEEKRAFEQLVDLVFGRLRDDPTLHVYHYGNYESAALKRLMSRHATREDELDILLRGRVLVDLYPVVRQGLRVSQESYSLKKVEKLYMPVREGPTTSPGFAIVEYERWLEARDPRVLDQIEAYNRDDCVSVWLMRSWLEERRHEAENAFGITLQRPSPPEAATEELTRQLEETGERVRQLLQGIPADKAARSTEQQARWLLAQLLDWHRREAKPEWWAYFDLVDRPMEELVASAEALGDLTYAGVVGEEKRSWIHRYSYDTGQEHKFHAGDKPLDPTTGNPAGEVVAVDPVQGSIDLKRGKTSKAPHPRALIPPKPRPTITLRDALRRVADRVIQNGLDSTGPYRAVLDILLHRRPDIPTLPQGALASPGEETLASARRLGVALRNTYLPIQGPPGSGKTYTAARMIVDLIRQGSRVGITAGAHKVITNLVDAVCDAALKEGASLRILQRGEEDETSKRPEVRVAGSPDEVEAAARGEEFDVVGGTPWLFARQGMEGKLDVLFVDEAGQMSLANAVAMGGAAHSMVLLGDPNQLPQVSRGSQPEGAEASVLEHILDGSPTIALDRGLFLELTRRLHPNICSYVSEVFYEGRLEAHASTHQQALGSGAICEGNGIWVAAIPHSTNASRSPEEAAWVVKAAQALLGRSWTDEKGSARVLGREDILIVVPYNAQVGEILRQGHELLGADLRVGTVDKFQGQEAAVAIYSMTTSAQEDAPRQMEFLYSGNRLNVAISRARAAALLVFSPGLLSCQCRSPKQMRLVNALCRLVEMGHVVTV